MVKREELNGMSYEDMVRLLEKDVAEYAAHTEEFVDEEAVLHEEERIMALQDAHQEYLMGVEYELPDGCTFDNTAFKASTMADAIADFISTLEVEWMYTSGVYDLVKIWKTRDLKKVPYGVYDSTVRILGQCKFKGWENWRKILAVNEYLSNSHIAYNADTTYTIYLGQLHNALITRLDSFHPKTEQVNENQE